VKTGYSYGFGREGLETKLKGIKWRPVCFLKSVKWMLKQNRKDVSDVSSYLSVSIAMFKSEKISSPDGKLDV